MESQQKYILFVFFGKMNLLIVVDFHFILLGNLHVIESILSKFIELFKKRLKTPTLSSKLAMRTV